LPASTISFVVGTLVLLALSLALRPALGGDFSAARGAPWWQLTGGLIGAMFVTTTVLLIPRLGATALVAGTIAGQLVGGVLIDYLGLFGLTRVPVTGYRLLGLALLVIGGMLTIKR
jgi:transporter family-2 protein